VSPRGVRIDQRMLSGPAARARAGCLLRIDRDGPSHAGEGGTNIEYRVDLELRSVIMSAVVTSLFSDGAGSMVNARVREAERIYGSRKIAVARNGTLQCRMCL
jgi:hypothetical protein